MTNETKNKIRILISELWRQYPLWPSTFSDCDCGRMIARGSGSCALCIEEELATLIKSKPKALYYRQRIEEIKKLEREMGQGMSE